MTEYLYRRYFEITQKVLTLLEDEVKVRHVRDAAYWGLPVGTPIEPGMKPVKPDAPEVTKPSTVTTKPTRRISPTTTTTGNESVEWLSGDDKPPEIPTPDGTEIVTREHSLWYHLQYDPVNKKTRIDPKREQFYWGLVDELLRNPAGEVVPGDQENPVYTMLGGGGGSGKSIMQRTAPGITPPDVTAKADADEVKELLWKRDPAYQDPSGPGNDKQKRPAFLHEESSIVVKMAQTLALSRDQHFMLDGTGNSSLAKLEGKIQEARAEGYEVNGIYASVPTQLAWARNIKRGKRDRFRGVVPSKPFSKAHAAVSQVAPQAASDYDTFEVYDMSEPGTATVIARCTRGGKIEVLDQEKWEGFLAKGDSWTPAELDMLTSLVPEEYINADMNDESALRKDPNVDWFSYGWRPSQPAPGTKADALEGIDDDVATAILVNVVLGVAFERTGIADTKQHREYWKSTEQSVANLPEGVTIDIPKEWPAPNRYNWFTLPEEK